MNKTKTCFCLLLFLVVFVFIYLENELNIFLSAHIKTNRIVQATGYISVLMNDRNIRTGVNTQNIAKYLSLANVSAGNSKDKGDLAKSKPPSVDNKTFKLLQWTEDSALFMAERKGSYYGIFDNCNYSNCEIIQDKMLLSESDAVIMHLTNLRKGMKRLLPNQHPPWQKWIAFNLEPPTFYARWHIEKFRGMFNASVTYRSTSTIQLPYGYVTRKPIPSRVAYSKNVSKGKTKLVAWFVSRCKRHSLRDDYVRDLQQYIPVHVYGKCGNYSCPRGNILNEDEPCRSLLQKDYKFYLAFENSLCKEYMTEKLFKALLLNVVPVVLGAANYNEILPPHSYIDIRSFTSPKHLAEYLLFLDKNPIAYNKYFSWKKHFTVRHHHYEDYVCQLCKYMNEYANVTNTGEPFDWVIDKECFDTEDFYKNVWKISM